VIADATIKIKGEIQELNPTNFVEIEEKKKKLLREMEYYRKNKEFAMVVPLWLW
jgi:hypothetical protein